MSVEALGAQPTTILIESLARLKAKAESGEINSLSYVAGKPGGDFLSGSINIDPVTTLGQLVILTSEALASHYSICDINDIAPDDGA